MPKSSHLREGLAKWGCSSQKVTVYTRQGGNTNRTLLTQLQPQGHTQSDVDPAVYQLCEHPYSTSYNSTQAYVSELETLDLLDEEQDQEEEDSDDNDLDYLRVDREMEEIMHFVFGDESEDEPVD